MTLFALLLTGCAWKLGTQPALPTLAQLTSLPTQTLTLQAQSLVTPSTIGRTPIPESAGVTQAEALLPQAQADLSRMNRETQYNLTVQIDFNKHAFQGTAQIGYTNQEDVPLESLYFRLYPNGHKSYGDGSLEVSTVLVEGLPVKTALSVSDTVLEVELPAPLSVNQKISLQMDFTGTVPEGFGNPDAPQGYGIYTIRGNEFALLLNLEAVTGKTDLLEHVAALPHMTHHDVLVVEVGIRFLDASFLYCLSDFSRTHRFVVDILFGNFFDLEPVFHAQLPQFLIIAFPVVTESVIIPHDQFSDSDLIHEDTLDEIPG